MKAVLCNSTCQQQTVIDSVSLKDAAGMAVQTAYASLHAKQLHIKDLHMGAPKVESV